MGKRKNIPDYQSLIRLSEIFNISVDEFLISKKSKKNNKSIFIKSLLELYQEKNKIKRRVVKLVLVIVILLFAFLSYYFVSSYNSIRVYDVSYVDNDIAITNGIFVTTKEKLYFRLGDISEYAYDNVKYLTLYYKTENGEEKLIMKTSNCRLSIVENNGYNEYFDCDNLDYIVDNLYLDVEFKDGVKTIKLELEKSFSNDKLFFHKVTPIG